MKKFFKALWLSFVAVGEEKLWFSGVVFIVSLCSIWLYAIFGSIISTPASLSDEWGITLIVVGVVIPMLLALVTGYVRSKMGLPSLESDKTLLGAYSDSRIVGLVWLANIAGVIFVIVLPKIIYDFVRPFL